MNPRRRRCGARPSRPPRARPCHGARRFSRLARGGPPAAGTPINREQAATLRFVPPGAFGPSGLFQRFISLVGVLAIAALLAGCRTQPAAAPVAEASVRPGINTELLKPDLNVAQWVERFEREGREIYDHRKDIVRAARIRPGMAVADIGAGTGLFTPLFSEAVGSRGTVYAVDIVPEFLQRIERRAAEAGLRNVRTVLCTERSVELPPRSVDLAFICDTYHHFEYPRSTMASLHRALRPGGEVVLIDFKRIPGESSDWVLNHVRAGQEVFEAEILAAGFRKIGEEHFLKDNYFVRFQKVGK